MNFKNLCHVIQHFASLDRFNKLKPLSHMYCESKHIQSPPRVNANVAIFQPDNILPAP